MEDDRAMWEQANLELMQETEDALNRAEVGQATQADWSLIRAACGLSKPKERANESSSESGF